MIDEPPVFALILNYLGVDVADLPPGRTEAEIARLELSIGYPLPLGLRLWHMTCGGEFIGQTDLGLGLIYGYEFLSLEMIEDQVRTWSTVREHVGTSLNKGEFESVPEGAIKDAYSLPGWIPFAGRALGVHLAIDFDPGPAGRVGQIINFGVQGTEHHQLAADFGLFEQQMLDHYRKGEWHPRFQPTWPGLSEMLRRTRFER